MFTRSLMLFGILRVLFFAIPFGLMMLLPIFRELWWLAAIFAALIGLSLSIILLRPRLDAASTSLHERSVGRRTAPTTADLDAAAEDD